MKIVLLTSKETKFIETLKEDISLVISNHPDERIIETCLSLNIPCEIIPHPDFPNRLDHDRAIKLSLDNVNPDIVILTGYNRIIKERNILEDYHKKIINIHFSLLPEFQGIDPCKQAFENKSKISGYTLHYIDEGIDTGEIIFQERVNISDCNSKKEIYNKILQASLVGITKVLNNL